MKKTPLLIILTLALMLLASTQALASPAASSVEAKKTPGPSKTPHVVPTHKPAGKPEQSHGKPENYRGTIAAVDASSLTLTLGDGSSVDFGLTADTRIKIPGLKGGSATDLQVGMTAMVQAFRDENNALVARAVMAIPGKPTRTHHVGWVTAYTPGVSITIQAHDGNFYTFNLTADTKILPTERAAELAVGSRVTIIARRVPSALDWTASGIVVHPAGSGAGSAPPTATPTSTPTDTPTPTP